VAVIFAEVLPGVDPGRLQRTSNFFALGGTSFSAVKAVARLNTALGVEAQGRVGEGEERAGLVPVCRRGDRGCTRGAGGGGGSGHFGGVREAAGEGEGEGGEGSGAQGVPEAPRRSRLP